MITLVPYVTFLAPVSVDLVGHQARFNLNLRLLPDDQVRPLQEAVKSGEKTGIDFAAAVIDGWPEGEVVSPTGEALFATPENVSALLHLVGVPAAVINAFWKGYEEATEGNSAPLPAGS